MRSEAVKLEREKRKTMSEERFARLYSDPQVIGLLTLLGGLYAAQRIPFSDDEGRNEAMKGVATAGVVLLAISRAGIGGWPALAAVGISGAAGGLLGGLETQIPPDVKSGLWAGIFPPMAIYEQLRR